MSRLQTRKPIPPHLKKFILKQDYSRYTPMDQAGWRYIMRISRDFFKEYAHEIYLAGLPATGMSIEHIPKITEMDQRLRKMGWRAAVISGFIPPAVFLEFLSLGILPIACDMRTPEHLSYTPAPDIVHEAAGHAPILLDTDYADYIRQYGEISQKVIFSKEDLDVYNAIRKLSDTKENPRSTEKQIQKANEELIIASRNNTTVSEATQLARMAWWTIEYGLVGDMENPKIYGAGLLSSVGESYDCYAKNVKKVPLTLKCIEQTYDITKPQPQLFVTPHFSHLKEVLREFGETMAYKIGGLKSLERAKDARTVTTTQWDSGVQFSGILSEVLSEAGEPTYLKWSGPCQLGLKEKEVSGYGPRVLKKTWECPVGPMAQNISQMADLKALGFSKTTTGTICWPRSGFAVTGKLLKAIKAEGQMVALLLKNVTVTRDEKPVSKHSKYLVILGEKVTGTFGDAADRGAFYKYVPTLHEPKAKQKTNLTKENREINQLYSAVRKIREARAKLPAKTAMRKLEAIVEELDQKNPTDWLLRLEILELATKDKEISHLRRPLLSKLEKIKNSSPEKGTLISRGLRLLSLHNEATIRTSTPSLHS